MRGAGGDSAGAVRTQGGNIYAGADGNVYRRTDDGWSKWNNGSWQPAQPPARSGGAGTGTQPQNAPGAGQQRGGTRATGSSNPQTRQAPSRAAPAPSGAGEGGFGMQRGVGGGQEFGSRDLGQLERDHQARQFGEMRQRSFGGGWGGAEPGLRGGRLGEGGHALGGGFGGLHRR